MNEKRETVEYIEWQCVHVEVLFELGKKENEI